MASRRTRIKGIANIPQRRKNVDETLVMKTEVHSEEETNPKEITQTKSEPVSFLPFITTESRDPEKLKQCVSDNDDKAIGESNIDNSSHENGKLDGKNILQPDPEKGIDLDVMKFQFVKPVVVQSNIKLTPDFSESGMLNESETAELPRDLVNVETSVEQGSNNTEINVQVDVAKSIQSDKERTLDEIHLAPCNGILLSTKPSIKPGGKEKLSSKPVTTVLNDTQYSDNEYPPPPPSPSKINRSRIKAIPRLAYRKTSFSASESEDETRKNIRIRNDSVCSTTSGIGECIIESTGTHKSKDVPIQKKCNRTEQTRKLAEARREFQRRFGANKPDRQRLRMMDLIFYNPQSNPMMQELKANSGKIEAKDEIIIDKLEVERERIEDPDDPVQQEETVSKSDEENEIPVPQIKISPSGEIILDEKSVVIERKEVKKQQEELQRTKLVDGDFESGYGIYKKHKRTRFWSPSETLRFYKALNSIGTDFTLMCDLFHNRTRRDLKMKFKKEEKINKTLIDKAMMQPCSFDFDELKHEMDMEEKELEELQRQKEEHMKMKQEKILGKSKKRKVSREENGISEQQKRILKVPRPKKSKLSKLSISSVLDDSDADESDMATQSESEEELILSQKPTRSGRVPKVTQKYETEDLSIESIMRRSKLMDTAKSNEIEPGSIMVYTEKGPNGEPVYKIFMVTQDNNASPLNLTSDLVSKAIQFKKGMVGKNIMTISVSVTDDEEDHVVIPEENNVTIPADGNVTSLKSNMISGANIKVGNEVTVSCSDMRSGPESSEI